MSLLAGVLNIAGNIVSVVIFDFGIVGIACATVFSGAVVAVCYLFKFRACLKELGVHKEKFRVNFEALRRSFHYALPNTLQQMAMYCAGMAMSPVVNGLGSSATAGYSVVQRIFDISAGFYQNSSKALVNYGAQCVGAGKIRLLKRGWRAGLLQGTLLALPIIAVCSIFARPVCALFFPSGFYGAALEYAVFFARFCLPLIYLNLLNNLYHARFRGMGAMKLNLATTAFASVVRVGAGALLAIPFGMYGVFYGMVLSWAAEVVLCDEIGSRSDAEAILAAANCGVPIVATAHARTVREILLRPPLRRLHDARVFSAYAGLSRTGSSALNVSVTDWQMAERIGRSL
jgi:Na+-driven multidrug efflux pump